MFQGPGNNKNAFDCPLQNSVQRAPLKAQDKKPCSISCLFGRLGLLSFAVRGSFNHRRLDSSLLHAEEPDEVDPQERPNECVCSADDKGEEMTELMLALEDGFNSTLLNNAYGSEATKSRLET